MSGNYDRLSENLIFISTVVLCGSGRFVSTSHRFRPLLARFFVFSFFLPFQDEFHQGCP